MIRTAKHTPMLELLRASGVFDRDPLIVFDAGCRGGISAAWDRFGAATIAHGFDPSIDECERLAAAERRPHVRYHAGYVGTAPARQSEAEEVRLNPWPRLSTAHALTRNAPDEAPAPRVADPACRIGVAEFARGEGWPRIDFLKIDVDGDDFDVLQSAAPLLDAGSIVGIAMEVNYYGSASPTANTFHNVDRYLRTKQYSLFGLDVRHYSRVDLPAPFATRSPAHTTFGAPLQGNALYFRDLAALNPAELARLDLAVLAKQAALFELFALPDCAAELVTRCRDRFDRLASSDVLLDALVQPLAPGVSHQEYRRRFTEDPDSFLAPVNDHRAEAAADVEALQSRILELEKRAEKSRRRSAKAQGALDRARLQLHEVAASREDLKIKLRAARGSRPAWRVWLRRLFRPGYGKADA